MIDLYDLYTKDLNTKEDEIINLKEEISILTEEVDTQKSNDQNTKALKDSRELVSGLKIQLEEAKGREEVLRSYLTKEEGTRPILNLGVEEFRKINDETNAKFNNNCSSSILYEI